MNEPDCKDCDVNDKGNELECVNCRNNFINQQEDDKEDREIMKGAGYERRA